MPAPNGELIAGTLWSAVLDRGTCPFCRALDGGMWFPDGTPMPDSPYQEDFPGIPPDQTHFGCRCVVGPVMKSWDELMDMAPSSGGGGFRGRLGRWRKRLGDLLSRLTGTERDELDGNPPETFTYEEWLRSRPESEQKDILGHGKWQLWQGGKITLTQMIDQSGNPLTIEELKAKGR